MKHFVDDNGLFEMEIPISWKYYLHNEKVHTFEEYDKRKFGTFQISLWEIKDKLDIIRFKQSTSKRLHVKFGNHTCYCFPENSNGKFVTKIWTSHIRNQIVIFTFTDSLEPIDKTPISEKLKLVYRVISKFEIIKKEERESKLHSYRFSMFIDGVGATAAILNNAIQNRAFIEATCILANQIDALLRIGIVLKKQIINNNSEIEQEWIYQGSTDRRKSEKEIYKNAKELEIINEDIFDRLYELYEDRNRVVHRFIISEITLAEIEVIAYYYYKVREQINQIIYELESEQINLNVGMTRIGPEIKNVKPYLEQIKWKIGKLDYFEENPVGDNVYKK